MKTFSLCGRKGACCPTATKTEAGMYIITDDNGRTIELTWENIKELYMQTAKDIADQVIKSGDIDTKTGQVIDRSGGGLQLKPKKDKKGKSWIN